MTAEPEQATSICPVCEAVVPDFLVEDHQAKHDAESRPGIWDWPDWEYVGIAALFVVAGMLLGLIASSL